MPFARRKLVRLVRRLTRNRNLAMPVIAEHQAPAFEGEAGPIKEKLATWLNQVSGKAGRQRVIVSIAIDETMNRLEPRHDACLASVQFGKPVWKNPNDIFAKGRKGQAHRQS